MEHEQTWIVTVSHTHIEQISSVVTSLEHTGLQVQQVLSTLGQVIGRAPEEKVEELKHVDGVESVDAEGQFKAL
ncbi:hypothetical protein [Glutamicibacter sp.]|uniref:hypothetical protein n=1 Tax=Glutamicibacter sp. TaxID=1931995 RepID=UPI0028BF143C|nr:hypothetical protein [Glutamicibacter sp.]